MDMGSPRLSFHEEQGTPRGYALTAPLRVQTERSCASRQSFEAEVFTPKWDKAWGPVTARPVTSKGGTVRRGVLINRSDNKARKTPWGKGFLDKAPFPKAIERKARLSEQANLHQNEMPEYVTSLVTPRMNPSIPDADPEISERFFRVTQVGIEGDYKQRPTTDHRTKRRPIPPANVMDWRPKTTPNNEARRLITNQSLDRSLSGLDEDERPGQFSGPPSRMRSMTGRSTPGQESEYDISQSDMEYVSERGSGISYGHEKTARRSSMERIEVEFREQVYEAMEDQPDFILGNLTKDGDFLPRRVKVRSALKQVPEELKPHVNAKKSLDDDDDLSHPSSPRRISTMGRSSMNRADHEDSHTPRTSSLTTSHLPFRSRRSSTKENSSGEGWSKTSRQESKGMPSPISRQITTIERDAIDMEQRVNSLQPSILNGEARLNQFFEGTYSYREVIEAEEEKDMTEKEIARRRRVDAQTDRCRRFEDVIVEAKKDHTERKVAIKKEMDFSRGGRQYDPSMLSIGLSQSTKDDVKRKKLSARKMVEEGIHANELAPRKDQPTLVGQVRETRERYRKKFEDWKIEAERRKRKLNNETAKRSRARNKKDNDPLTMWLMSQQVDEIDAVELVELAKERALAEVNAAVREGSQIDAVRTKRVSLVEGDVLEGDSPKEQETLPVHSSVRMLDDLYEKRGRIAAKYLEDSSGEDDILEMQAVAQIGKFGWAKVRSHVTSKGRKIDNLFDVVTEFFSRLHAIRSDRYWWTLKSAPRIIDISPPFGDLSGWTRVQITGAGFGDDDDVPIKVLFSQRIGKDFITNKAFDVRRINSEKIICLTPPGVHVGKHLVHIEVAGVSTANPFMYTYVGPQILGVYPPTVFTNTTARVVIRGQCVGRQGDEVNVYIGNKAVRDCKVSLATKKLEVLTPVFTQPGIFNVVITRVSQIGVEVASHESERSKLMVVNESDPCDSKPMKFRRIKRDNFGGEPSVLDIQDLFKKSQDPASDIREIMHYLYDYQATLMSIFYYYAMEASANGEDDPNDISSRQFIIFAEESRLFGKNEVGPKFPKASLDIIFVRANREWEEEDDNDDSALVYKEFVSALIRIAHQKYLKHERIPDRVRALFNEHLFPYSKKMNDQTPFLKLLCSEDMQHMIKEHQKHLHAAFDKYSLADATVLDGSHTMNAKEFDELVEHYGLPRIRDLPMRLAFAKSNIGDWADIPEDHPCHGVCFCYPGNEAFKVLDVEKYKLDKQKGIIRKKPPRRVVDVEADPRELSYDEFVELLVRLGCLHAGIGDDTNPNLGLPDMMAAAEEIFEHFHPKENHDDEVYVGAW